MYVSMWILYPQVDPGNSDRHFLNYLLCDSTTHHLTQHLTGSTKHVIQPQLPSVWLNYPLIDLTTNSLAQPPSLTQSPTTLTQPPTDSPNHCLIVWINHSPSDSTTQSDSTTHLTPPPSLTQPHSLTQPPTFWLKHPLSDSSTQCLI